MLIGDIVGGTWSNGGGGMLEKEGFIRDCWTVEGLLC